MKAPTKAEAQAVQQTGNQEQAGAPGKAIIQSNIAAQTFASEAVYLDCQAAAAARVALHGIGAVIAILNQHNTDSDSDGGGIELKPNVIEGLLCAVESCTRLVADSLNGDMGGAIAFANASPAEQEMTWAAARHRMTRQNGRT